MDKKRLAAITITLLFPFGGTSLPEHKSNSERHYLFSYFKGNGEDGLHLAHSTDGYRWRTLLRDQSFLTPKVGQARLMRDPSIVTAPDGTFHMVWTAGWWERGIGYAKSSDLIHWSEQRYLPVMEHEPEALNCWAPEPFYDEAGERYLIFWASTIPGRFPETDGQGAGDGGPGKNHRIYCVETRDFETLSETRLFYDHGFNVIDTAIVKAGAGHAMFLKDETDKPFKPQKNIRLAFSERAEGPYGPASRPITGDYWAEGPTAIRIGREWFLYFDKYRLRRYGLMVSVDLETWRDQSDRLVVPEGMRHGTAFEVSEKVAVDLLSIR